MISSLLVFKSNNSNVIFKYIFTQKDYSMYMYFKLFKWNSNNKINSVRGVNKNHKLKQLGVKYVIMKLEKKNLNE